MEKENLEDVMKKIKERDKSALEVLYKEMKGCIYGLAYVYTESHSDAEDMVQNTFLHIWNRADTYKTGNPRSWIMTIARNLSLDHIRSRKNTAELDENIHDTDHISQVINKYSVKQLLANLGEEEREIVLLYSYGFSHSEISKIIKKPYSTVRWKYSYAIKKLIKISGGEKINE